MSRYQVLYRNKNVILLRGRYLVCSKILRNSNVELLLFYALTKRFQKKKKTRVPKINNNKNNKA